MTVNVIVKLAELYSEATHPRGDYMREYMRNRYHAKRKEVIDLLGGPKCSRCGSTEGPFQIDHIDRKKKTFRAADVHSVNEEALKKELPNLRVLCKKCHAKKTHEAWDFNAPKPRHATYWFYRRHGCRCPLCTKAYKEKGKEWRDKRRKALQELSSKAVK